MSSVHGALQNTHNGDGIGSFSAISSLVKLARPEGLEPSTFRSGIYCSVQLSYGRGDAAYHERLAGREAAHVEQRDQIADDKIDGPINTAKQPLLIVPHFACRHRQIVHRIDRTGAHDALRLHDGWRDADKADADQELAAGENGRASGGGRGGISGVGVSLKKKQA